MNKFFKPGDKITCNVDLPGMFTAGKMYEVSDKTHPWATTGQVTVVADDQGRFNSWDENHFTTLIATVTKKTQFELGDRVRVVGPGYTGKTGMIYSLIKSPRLPDRVVILGDWDGQLHNFVPGDLVLDKTESSEHKSQFGVEISYKWECDHDWKIYHGFMHDDEFCTKCKVTRKLSA